MYKYPRTYHFPWSDSLQNDDRMIEDPTMFDGKQVVVTIKMDGENTTMYSDHIHARSLDSLHHPSRNFVKGLWGSIKHDIPEGWRICGENMYATHAIKYENLRSYFYVFSVWTDKNECLSWSDTMKFCVDYGLHLVTTLYMGVWDEEYIRTIGRNVMELGYDDPVEGYVVRLRDSFHYDDFSNNVAKCVRKGHVGATDDHWMVKWNPSMVNRLV